MITEDKHKSRPDLKCLVIDDEIWDRARLLAQYEGKSRSSLVRGLINQAFKKSKNKLEALGS